MLGFGAVVLGLPSVVMAQEAEVALATETPPKEVEPVTDDGRSASISRTGSRLSGDAEAEDLNLEPLPHEADGLLIPRDRSQYSWMWIPRAMLFVPRWTLEVPMAMSRYGIWVYEHYDVRDRVVDLFFNDDRTVGLYPTLALESGFGLPKAGGRFVWREIGGSSANIAAAASYGRDSETTASFKLTAGELWDDSVEVGAYGKYRNHRSARFFGIGNGDLLAAEEVMPGPGERGIDPLQSEVAVATRFRFRDINAELVALKRLRSDVSVRISGGYRYMEFHSPSDLLGDVATEDVYDLIGLIGYQSGLYSLYSEIELAYDSRRVSATYLPLAAPSTGQVIDVWARYQRGLYDDPSRFLRWGAEMQRYFDLWRGDRVLVLRARLEGVSGEIEDIPFVDLPALGGPYLLRGYERQRFRDRYAGLFTVEYDYPVQRMVTGYLFVDAGQVWGNFADLEVADSRLGFGAGMQLHLRSSYYGRIAVASSIDGGIQFYLALDPVFGARKKARRAK